MTEADKANEPKTDSDKLTWFDRLAFYTRDFTKDEKINLVSYIAWVKCEFALKEAEEIKAALAKATELDKK